MSVYISKSKRTQKEQSVLTCARGACRHIRGEREDERRVAQRNSGERRQNNVQLRYIMQLSRMQLDTRCMPGLSVTELRLVVIDAHSTITRNDRATGMHIMRTFKLRFANYVLRSTGARLSTLIIRRHYYCAFAIYSSEILSRRGQDSCCDIN